MITNTTFLCQLTQAQQREILEILKIKLTDIGYDELEIQKMLNSAKENRLVDLEEYMDIEFFIEKYKTENNTKKIVYDTETGGLDLNKVTSQVHVDNTQKPLDSCKWVSTVSDFVRREFKESDNYAWFHLTTVEKIMFKYNNGLVQEFDVSEDIYSEEARDYTVIVFNQEEKFIVVDSPDNIISNYDEYNGLKFKIPSNSQIIVDKVDNKTLEVYINII